MPDHVAGTACGFPLDQQVEGARGDHHVVDLFQGRELLGDLLEVIAAPDPDHGLAAEPQRHRVGHGDDLHRPGVEQPLDPLAGRGLGQAKRAGCFTVGLLLEVTKQHDLSVIIFETIERRVVVFGGQTAQADFTLSPARFSQSVVVTARRVEEVAQDVPIPVSVVKGDLVSDTGAFNVNRLKELIPTVQFYSTNPRNSTINIRGLGAPFGLTNDGLEQGVGLYIDGVYFARPASATLDFLDVDQVEVLRGPEGTLFGKNTTAGALNVTTGAASAVSVTTGTGSTTINAGAMTAGEILTLKGSTAATVTVGGKTATGGDVIFDPKTSSSSSVAVVKSPIGKDGSYTAKTYVGTNHISVSAPEATAEQKAANLTKVLQKTDTKVDVAIP